MSQSYIASSLLVIKEALQSALYAIGPVRLPIPGQTMEESGVDVYGDIGTIDHLAASMPKVSLTAFRPAAELCVKEHLCAWLHPWVLEVLVGIHAKSG